MSQDKIYQQCLENEIFEYLPFREIKYPNRFITFADVHTFTKLQVGHRVDISGQSLIHFLPGDWKDSWFVIGRDHTIKSSIFVDLKQLDFPIFIGSFYENSWKTKCIANSFLNYITIIRWIGQMEIAPEVKVRVDLIESIDHLGEGYIDSDYWKKWMLNGNEKEGRFF